MQDLTTHPIGIRLTSCITWWGVDWLWLCVTHYISIWYTLTSWQAVIVCFAENKELTSCTQDPATATFFPKNVFHFLCISAHGHIQSNSVSEYTHWKVSPLPKESPSSKVSPPYNVFLMGKSVIETFFSKVSPGLTIQIIQYIQYNQWKILLAQNTGKF